MSGITYRSVKGSKLTSAEVDHNFQYLENLVGGSGNSITTQTGFSLAGQDLTINAGWEWKILTVSYTNASSVLINIPLAAAGNERIDLIVANQSNTFERIAGIESISNPSAPSVPANKIIVTFITVTDGEVGNPSAPITGSQFKQKNESSKYTESLTGTNQVIQFRTAGQQHYVISGAVTSVAGFGKTLLDAFISSEVPYSGKDIFVQNATDHEVTLKNDFSGVDVKFLLGADLVVPANGIVWLKYDGRFETLSLFFKSWSENVGVDFPVDGKTYGVKDGLAVDLGVNIDMDYPNFIVIQSVGNGFNYLGTYAHSITGTQSDFNSADSYQYRRILSANTAGSLAIMNDAGLYRVGPTKGFYYRARIKQEDSTNIPTARFSYGFSGTASVGNINPSNYVQVLLSFAADASDTNCQIMYKNSTGTATKINLGSTMPKSSSDDYIIEFLRLKGTTVIFYKITNTTTSAVVSGSFSYAFTALALGNYKNNEAVASSCGFGVRRVELYITD